jgi:hypothetical protein
MTDMAGQLLFKFHQKPFKGLSGAFRDHSDRSIGFIADPASKRMGRGESFRGPAKTDPLNLAMEDDFGSNRWHVAWTG